MVVSLEFPFTGSDAYQMHQQLLFLFKQTQQGCLDAVPLFPAVKAYQTTFPSCLYDMSTVCYKCQMLHIK